MRSSLIFLSFQIFSLLACFTSCDQAPQKLPDDPSESQIKKIDIVKVVTPPDTLPRYFQGNWVDDCNLDIWHNLEIKFLKGAPTMNLYYGVYESSNGFGKYIHTNEKFKALDSVKNTGENKYQITVKTNLGPTNFELERISRAKITCKLLPPFPKKLKHLSERQELIDCQK
jgi:hypothetical protein